MQCSQEVAMLKDASGPRSADPILIGWRQDIRAALSRHGQENQPARGRRGLGGAGMGMVGDGFFIYDCFDCNSAVVEC